MPEISGKEFTEILSQLHEYLTPKQIAKDLGVTTATIKAWECGKVPTDMTKRVAIYEKMRTHSIWEENG